MPNSQTDSRTKPVSLYAIGYFQVDFAEMRTEKNKRHLFVAITISSQFAFAELHVDSDRIIDIEFLQP